MHADDNDLDYARVAIRAGKRVGGAVVRNREKRMLREAFRVRQHELPAIDMICSVRATDVAVADYARALLKLSREAARKLERSARGRG